MKILVIDDEPVLRSVIGAMLRSLGHEVAEASDGRIGMDILRGATYDLVLTDIIMPNQEGIETIRAIVAKYPAMKIIAMSGGGSSANFDFLDIAKEFGASAMLQKPFHKEQLRDVLRAVMTPQ